MQGKAVATRPVIPDTTENLAYIIMRATRGTIAACAVRPVPIPRPVRLSALGERGKPFRNR